MLRFEEAPVDLGGHGAVFRVFLRVCACVGGGQLVLCCCMHVCMHFACVCLGIVGSSSLCVQLSSVSPSGCARVFTAVGSFRHVRVPCVCACVCPGSLFFILASVCLHLQRAGTGCSLCLRADVRASLFPFRTCVSHVFVLFVTGVYLLLLSPSLLVTGVVRRSFLL